MTTRNKGGGQPGNKNATKRQPWRRALDRELAQYEATGVPRGEALSKIAIKCIEQALDGCPIARAEIANRLDGKPKEHVEHDFSARLAQELTDDELQNIARRGGDGAAAEAGGAEEPSELH